MSFLTYRNEKNGQKDKTVNENETEVSTTINDIMDIVGLFDESDYSDIVDSLLDLLDDLYETGEDEYDLEEDLSENLDSIEEVKYFQTTRKQLQRAKKKNPAQRRQERIARAREYKRNKQAIKRKQRLYRKRVKSGAQRVTKHRGN